QEGHPVAGARSDQSRRRDHAGSSRRAALRHPPAGDQRPGGADGGAGFAVRSTGPDLVMTVPRQVALGTIWIYDPGLAGAISERCGTMQPTADQSKSTPAAPVEPLPEQIGRYRILDRLGGGGMGTVYKAHDPQLDRAVALKLPRFDGPAHDRLTRVQRFQREARAAAQVFHPHVCPIFDVGEYNGQPYVVMAYVEGQSLAERLARE